MLPVHLCFCGGEGPEREIFRQMRFSQERRHRRVVFFFSFLCQEIRNAASQLLWDKNKNSYSDTKPCKGEKVTQRTAYVWGANSSQALYNVKITKTKYGFEGSDCEEVNKGKGDSFKNGKYCLVYLFYFLAALGLVAARRLSLVVASGDYSSLWCVGFSLRWLLLLRSTSSRHVGSVVVARGLQSAGSVVVAHGHVGSSPTRERTCVPCIGRRVLNHCATRDVPALFIYELQNHFLIFWQQDVLISFYRMEN